MELGSIVFIDDAGFETTFDIDELSLHEKLFGSLCEGTPDNTIGIFRFREWFTRWSLVVTIGRDGEGCDFLVTGCSLHEWILGNISDQDDLIDGSHREKIKKVD